MYLIALFLILGLISCGRVQNIPDHLDDDFLFPTAEGLIRIEDLTVILDEETTKPQTDSERQLLENHETILSTKENLYGDNIKSNVFNLNELLRIHTVEEGKKVKISSGLQIYLLIPPSLF